MGKVDTAGIKIKHIRVLKKNYLSKNTFFILSF